MKTHLKDFLIEGQPAEINEVVTSDYKRGAGGIFKLVKVTCLELVVDGVGYLYETENQLKEAILEFKQTFKNEDFLRSDENDFVSKDGKRGHQSTMPF